MYCYLQVRLGSANANNEAAIVVGVVAKFYQHVVALEFNADKSAVSEYRYQHHSSPSDEFDS